MAAFFTRARRRATTAAASIVTGSLAVLLTSRLTHDDKDAAAHVAHAQAQHQANDLHKWSQVGLPAFDTTYMFRENFVICYDSRTRNPKWVMERLTKETCTGEADRRVVAFYEEGSVDHRFRSKNSDYLAQRPLPVLPTRLPPQAQWTPADVPCSTGTNFPKRLRQKKQVYLSDSILPKRETPL